MASQMYETGIAYSLQDLGEKFIIFAQQSTQDVEAWELMRDRLDSFYGTTLKVPLENGEYFYVSLQHTTVTEDTYPDWLRTGFYSPNEHYQKPITSDKRYKDAPVKQYYQSELYNHSTVSGVNPISGAPLERSSQAIYGTADRENIFKNTGEFLAIGCHTHFDEKLWMCEQGGITCNKESTRQINDINLVKVFVTEQVVGGSYPYSASYLPVFPGTGCPWFTLSDDNKRDYLVSIYGITYWFTKTSTDATITFRMNVNSNSYILDDVFQNICFGKMNCFDDDSYPFPLFVAGGNQALSQDMLSPNIYQFDKSFIEPGNVYDLDIKNICFSNSNLLHPTKFNYANMSNFRVLAPDGEWKDIYVFEQRVEQINYYSCGPMIPMRYGIPLQEVRDIAYYSKDYHTATPGCGYMYLNTTDTYNIREELDKTKYDTPLTKVIVALNKNSDYGANGIIGVLPNAFMSWSKELPCGEVMIGNNKYLCIPNGWENRLWHYPTVVGKIVNDEWDNDTVYNKYNEYVSNSGKYKIGDRLIIFLE